MSISRIDYLFNAIGTANKNTLHKIKAVINEAYLRDELTVTMYMGLNQAIRCQADRLIKRSK
jgi:hypothetical protein